MHLIISPLVIQVSKKKKFYLNLNGFRNENFFTLNTAKKLYKESILNQVKLLPQMSKIKLHFTIYPKDKKLFDLGNLVSIQRKFFEDVLTSEGIITDDNYTIVLGASDSFGEIDKLNARCEITIIEIRE